MMDVRSRCNTLRYLPNDIGKLTLLVYISITDQNTIDQHIGIDSTDFLILHWPFLVFTDLLIFKS